MAALRVNQGTKKTYSLKRIGTGDGGLMTDKTKGLFNK